MFKKIKGLGLKVSTTVGAGIALVGATFTIPADVQTQLTTGATDYSTSLLVGGVALVVILIPMTIGKKVVAYVMGKLGN